MKSEIPSESLAHLSKKKQKQLLAVLDRYPECFSDTPGYTEEVEHAIPLLRGTRATYMIPICMHALQST